MVEVEKFVNKKRRAYGEYLTPTQILNEFILPYIRDKLHDYIWIDLFAGSGNLILPILELIPKTNRAEFFSKHIFLFDIQEELVEKAILNAVEYGIPRGIAENNIQQRDTITDYPSFLLGKQLPIYHITNPPYLYIGYISKHEDLKEHLKYFSGENEGYQDLYQLALINDLRNGIQKMIYIIPSNFMFGFSVSNKIRRDFLKYYTIKKAIIFEKQIFDNTGTNVGIFFFERKRVPAHEIVTFEGIKINKKSFSVSYTLDPQNNYRAGTEFEEFLNDYVSSKPLSIRYYLTIDEIEKNRGDFKISLIDANSFDGRQYRKIEFFVNEELYSKIKSNILFIRTLDTGSMDGRVGLYKIREIFGVDGIVVTKAKYRTHPIQIFIDPAISEKDQILLMDYFNLIIEYFREKNDSEFLTTYKYSESDYTRKYLGLSQAKKLIQTFPIFSLSAEEKEHFNSLVESKNVEEVISFVKSKNKKITRLEEWF